MFNKAGWVSYFFTKKYTMEKVENGLDNVLMIAENVMAPKHYPAQLAFQLYANGCARQAEQIIKAAKIKYPNLPYDSIPEFIAEDEKSFASGENPYDIIKRRAETMYLTFTGKPMDEDLKDFLTEPPEDERPVRKPGEFCLGDFVVMTDEGQVAGQLSGIDTVSATGISRLQIVTESGEYGFGLAQEFRLMTDEEIASFQKKRRYIDGIE